MRPSNISDAVSRYVSCLETSRDISVLRQSHRCAAYTLFVDLQHPLLLDVCSVTMDCSFTPNLITVILSTINYLSLNYPVFSISRTLLLVLS